MATNTFGINQMFVSCFTLEPTRLTPKWLRTVTIVTIGHPIARIVGGHSPVTIVTIVTIAPPVRFPRDDRDGRASWEIAP